MPKTDGERVYVIVCTFIGNSMFAFMIGKITSLASQMDASAALYHEKMDAVVRLCLVCCRLSSWT